MQVLVTGATGFIGRRLAPQLVAAGHSVRAMTRAPERYEGAGEPVGADVADPASIRRALDGCAAAFYLVHSLDEPDFVRRDAEAAEIFAAQAAAAGVGRLIYLGGLGEDSDDLSPHLRSRRQVERLLAGSGVPVTVLRAGIIIGAGGISWELLRQLVAHLPVMITPRWVNTRCQPIAVDDVLAYLAGVLTAEAAAGRTFDVGGPEVLTYADMLRRVARQQHRPLAILPVPLLSPRLSSRWLSLVTDVDVTTARALVDSMTNEVVVQGQAIAELVPLERLDFDEAVRRALAERAQQDGAGT